MTAENASRIREDQLDALKEILSKTDQTVEGLLKAEAMEIADGAIVSLDLQGLGIGRLLPHVFKHLGSLQWLNLQGNRLATLPEELGLLSNLSWLNLRDNQLVGLPPSFVRLSRLSYLNLSGNRIRLLPYAIIAQLKLQTLDLRANPLEDPSLAQFFAGKYLIKLMEDIRTEMMPVQPSAPKGEGHICAICSREYEGTVFFQCPSCLAVVCPECYSPDAQNCPRCERETLIAVPFFCETCKKNIIDLRDHEVHAGRIRI